VYRVSANGMRIASPANLIYSGNIVMRNGYIYRATVDDYEGVRLEEFCCLDGGGVFTQTNGYNNQFGYYDEHEHFWEDQYWLGNNAAVTQVPVAPLCMNDLQFGTLLQSIRNTTFASTRKNIVKSALMTGNFSTAQLNTLLAEFTFASDKLEVAKMITNNIVDPQNIFAVYDAFTFANDRDAYAQYIQMLSSDPNSNFSRNLAIQQQIAQWQANGGNNNWNNGNGNGNWNNGNGNWNNGGGNNNNGNWNNGWSNGNGWNNNGNNNGNNGNWNNNNNNNGNWNNNGGGTMDANTFNAFLQTVRNSRFDSGRTTIVKTQLANAWITAQQLRQVVEVFDYESSKLDIAKSVATRVVDRNNLFVVYDAFDYESSKQNFAQFVAQLN
jgi:hypothetical protein